MLLQVYVDTFFGQFNQLIAYSKRAIHTILGHVQIVFGVMSRF